MAFSRLVCSLPESRATANRATGPLSLFATRHSPFAIRYSLFAIRPSQPAPALPDQRQRNAEHQKIRDLVEWLGRRAPHQPDAQKVARNGERQQGQRGTEVAQRELAEQE